ncbi:SgcJ/EcaC family oxidoreductase [Nonomuraea sp. H19]|uniref:SgcJ/EcaC family oxidoreductase n=1 Tax=Nonomuraea sp. H19 TaxID=3452206 RepID=UPI003F8B0BE0
MTLLIWTTGGGKRLFGRDAISTFTHQVLPGGMQGLTVTFEVEHVLCIRPDVAAVKVRQVYRNPDGTEEVGTPTRTSRPRPARPAGSFHAADGPLDRPPARRSRPS